MNRSEDWAKGFTAGVFVTAVLYSVLLLATGNLHAPAPHPTADHPGGTVVPGAQVPAPTVPPMTLDTSGGTTWNSFPMGSVVLLSNVSTANLMEIGGPNGELLVKIGFEDGKVTYGKTYTPDAAAKAFWDAIGTKYPCALPKGTK